nr:carboxypeptidase regulatory-like domain-containing protein [Bacteroidota bacterium]
MIKTKHFLQWMKRFGCVRHSLVTILCFALTVPLAARPTYQQLRQTTGNKFVDEYGQVMKNNSSNDSEAISWRSQSDRNSWESLGPYGGDVVDIAICPDNTSIVFATVGAPFISADGGTNWSLLNALGAVSSSIDAFCALPGGKILAGGSGLFGKIAISTDYGESWNTISLPQNSAGQPVYVLDIEYAPSNPDIIFLGASTAFGNTKSEVIYKSTNGGQTFEIMNTDVLDPALPVVDLSIDPINTNTIFACASGGLGGGAVIVSTDGGTTWFDRSAGLNTAWVINAVCTYNGVGYVAGGQLFGSQNFGVYKTTNQGQNWTNISSGFPVKAVNEVIVSPTNADIVFAGTEGGGVYKSMDAGATWSYTTTGANNFACRRLVINPANGQEIIGGFLSMAVFKSMDGGSTWVSSNTGIGAMMLNDIAVNPANPQQMIVAFEAQNSGGCYYSIDGGSSWILAETLPATRYSAVAIDVNGVLYAWSNGPSTVAQEGLYKSTDGGATWVNKGPNIGPVFETEIWDIEVSNEPPDFIIISGNNFGNNGWKGVLYKSNDGGDTWDNVFISQLDYDSFQQASIPDIPPYNIAYAAFSSQDGPGGFMKSIDGGNNWAEINTGLQGDAKRATWIVTENGNPDVVYGLAGANETFFTVYKSIDGGSHWTDLNLHTSAWESLTCLAVHPENNAVIYVGGSVSARAVYFTVTGGDSWQYAINNFPITSPTSFTKMFPKNDGYFFCASTYSASAHMLEAANPEYITINGLVTDFTLGTPVADALVTLDGEMADYEVSTNAQGTFEIEGFVAGTYSVEVQAAGYNTYHADN